MVCGQPVVYLDHNATTPLRAEVVEAMGETLAATWGNPSSIHAVGRRARAAVEGARQEVAALVGATPEEVVFTSGGTEGNHLAIRGLAVEAARARRASLGGRAPHVVSSPLEHPSVTGALAELRREGFEITLLPCDEQGRLDPAALAEALRAETVLVTLALANHEIGNVYPIRVFAELARARGARFHTDAVQAAGRLPVDFRALGVDALTLSGHKLYGPKGIGAVVLGRPTAAHPLAPGGHQERERRAGTENVAGIVGLGAAARLARAELDETAARIGALRAELERRLLALPGARLHGAPEARVPGTTNVGFAGVDGELVLINLDLEGICVSTGAACTSGTLTPSPVLRALGLSPADAREGVRFSLGRGTTADEVERVGRLLPGILERVRGAAGG